MPSLSLSFAAVASVAMASPLVVAWFLRSQKENTSHNKSKPNPDGIVLYRFDPPSGQPYGDKSCSPFGIKVETFLRLAHLDYETPLFSVSSILKNPKRKLPTCRIDNVTVADSTFIIQHILEKSNYSVHAKKHVLCDEELTPQQRALGLAVKALCEESLYFMIGYWRYQADEGFLEYTKCNTTLHNVWQPFRYLLERLTRRGIVEQLWQQGIGRHSREEVERLGRDAVDALETFLEDSNTDYLLSTCKPSIYDATLFAFCSAIVEMKVQSPLKDYALQKENIRKYLNRINQECQWPTNRL